ncbi:aspartate ammonia-lyase [Candidatus Micrarchaeota archaeon]|nr:aspartate ammonia-lyase [Candidatus Micrarchaeota archaeon]MBU1165903.1 aspartate ammonia-lyase [Candidatus Micrarchaeota archaeon]MBU1887102.1 aspartate ammonia-lyase [Candidatus Micrarchaeota archaeon]
MKTRKESDFLGEMEVPEDAYYGIFTVRASSTFKLSGQMANPEFVRAVIVIKKAAALANKKLGMLEAGKADAITKAADEALAGKYDNQFIIDAFQAGAGTPTHMNVNEVLANRANEILDGEKGKYDKVHPNNHVNMSQSSNNVMPSAVRIACVKLSKKLAIEMELLENEFRKKADRYSKTMKCGRTHLMDAVPMTYGQMFGAYAEAIDSETTNLERSLEKARELGIGGTATGTGITAHPEFRKTIVAEINKIENNNDTGIEGEWYVPAKDPVEKTQSMNDLLFVSGVMRNYASTLNRIANDLRLLGSGPNAGITEIKLPAIEPGSSIMPGKVNPSIPEAVNMICWQVCGNDRTIELAAQSGQLELNFGAPIIAHNLLQSLVLLTNGTRLFREECIEGMEVDEERTKSLLEGTFAQATALNPYLGYSLVSKLVTESQKNGIPIKELVLQKRLMEKNDLEKVLSVSGPAITDSKILERVRKQK